MFIRCHARFKIAASKAKAIVRAAKVVASDETGVRATNEFVADIEGTTPIIGSFIAGKRSCISRQMRCICRGPITPARPVSCTR